MGIDPAQGPNRIVLIAPVRRQASMAVDDNLERPAPRLARTTRQDLEEATPAQLLDDPLHVGFAAGSRERGDAPQPREDGGTRGQGSECGGYWIALRRGLRVALG